MNPRKLISTIFVLSIFGFLFWNIYKNWETVTNFPWRFQVFDLAVLSIFLFPLYFINVLSWHLITRALGTRVDFRQNLRIWVLSNVARFLPGGFWQYPGRIWLFTKAGQKKTVGLAAVIVEAIFNLAVGAAVVFAAFYFWQLPLDLERVKGVLWLLLLVPLSLPLLTSKTFLKKITPKKIDRVTIAFRWLGPIAAVFFLQYIFAGTVLFFLAQGAVSLSFNLWPTFVGIFTASWLLGYVTVFAPSGLGVQEASMAGLLSFYLPLPVASVIAILFRVMLIFSEIFILGLVFLTLKKPLDLGGRRRL